MLSHISGERMRCRSPKTIIANYETFVSKILSYFQPPFQAHQLKPQSSQEFIHCQQNQFLHNFNSKILYLFLLIRKTAFQCFKTAFYFCKTPFQSDKTPFCFCLILKPLFQSKKSLPQLHTLGRPFYASINLKSKKRGRRTAKSNPPASD